MSTHATNFCTPEMCEALMDAVPYAMLFVDRGGTVHAVNRVFGDFFGIVPEAHIGNPLLELGAQWEKAFAEPMAYHEVVTHPFEDSENRFARDVEITAPEHRFVEVISVPVYRGQAFSGRFWIARDVTSEREITELKIQYGGQRSAEEIKAKFLTVASHQLRTPMNSIRWNLELLMSGEAGPLSEAIETRLSDSYKSLINSLSIVDDLLLATDIQQRVLTLEKTSVDLTEVVEKVIHDFAMIADLHGQRLSFAAGEKLPLLFLDANRIASVFNRLLSNAIKYTPDGGTVSVETRLTDTAAEVIVRDSGIGFTEADRMRLFEPFYRTKRAFEMNPNASGLGLYIAKYIVEAHDGRIACESSEGRGSVFTVTLPLRPNEANIKV